MEQELIEAKKQVRISEYHLRKARIINDAVEGWLGTKDKPSEELEGVKDELK